jgi:hypothetical protein
MWGWLKGIFGRGHKASPEGHQLFDELSQRDREILQRELADSRRNAMGDPGDSLSGATGIFGTRTSTKIALNAQARTENGSLPNVGQVER